MIVSTLQHAFMITGFVFIMMLVIEYIHVQTRGGWQEKLTESRWGQYLIASVLGVIPGCLGPFTVVALYAHNTVGFGALVASMIATSGDEAYVMLSMFPGKALVIFLVLLPIGFFTGWLTDRIARKYRLLEEGFPHRMVLHEQDYCECFIREQIMPQLRHLTLQRGLLMGILLLFLAGLITGNIGPSAWNWIRVTLLLSGGFGLFVATTVPEHFLEEHLWEHVVKRHLPRIFAWTFGALLAINLLTSYLDLQAWIQANQLMVLLIAVLVGIIPESGPHMLFVTLFAQGSLPFSILLASSVVQDGHGTLPLLAVSSRAFLWLKSINVLIGIIVGLFGLLVIGF